MLLVELRGCALSVFFALLGKEFRCCVIPRLSELHACVPMAAAQATLHAFRGRVQRNIGIRGATLYEHASGADKLVFFPSSSKGKFIEYKPRLSGTAHFILSSVLDDNVFGFCSHVFQGAHSQLLHDFFLWFHASLVLHVTSLKCENSHRSLVWARIATKELPGKAWC